MDRKEINTKKSKSNNLKVKVKANKANKRWKFNQNHKVKSRIIIQKEKKQTNISNLKNLIRLMSLNLK
jgi:3-hydroxymyristoyl/3-hydroxydecanoyl-(acyl carrier protein) dehydratase